ncbi:MAG: CDP-diacylglycerol--serine O-phosphatidyltransferase [Mucinivorans sp.]
MKKIISFIPNTLTLGNLMCGTMAIIFAFDNNFVFAFWAVIVAAVFDFFDGFAARGLKAYSPIGADLDSLSDLVSFGVAPALIMYSLMAPLGAVAYAPLVLIPCAALRLAKFNIDDRQHTEFRGLPTPAMALFFISFQFTALYLPCIWITVTLCAIFAALMVCDIPMFSLKFSDFSFKNNALRYSFIVAVVLVIVLASDVYMVPWIIISLYIVTSLVRWIVKARD